MKVTVIEGRTGYFDHLRRRHLPGAGGDVFTIPDQPRRAASAKEMDAFPILREIADAQKTVPLAFSARWMTPIEESAPERTTSAPQALQHFHDATLAERQGIKDSRSNDVETI